MNVASEIGRLKKVLLHRPYAGLLRLTPDNCDRFLFDDVLWPSKAEEEHEQFAALLRSEGAEVFFVSDLIEEVLSQPEAREHLIRQYLGQDVPYSRPSEGLMQYLRHLSAQELTLQLFRGLTFSDIAPYHLGLASEVSDADAFIFPPLPNALFARDSSIWIKQGLCLSRMAFDARSLETAVMSTLYRHHPFFSSLEVFWYEGDRLDVRLPSIEGGDVLVLNDHTLMIGMGERTQPQAVEMLAKNLFEHNAMAEILAVRIPNQRSSMHLDTLLTMVDHDAFCTSEPTLPFQVWSITAGNSPSDLVIQKEAELSKALVRVLGVRSLRIISTQTDSFTSAREQWNDAANVFALRPGVVVAYAQNEQMNTALRKAGIEVLPLWAPELSRGRGGSRCMTCPIERERP